MKFIGTIFIVLAIVNAVATGTAVLHGVAFVFVALVGVALITHQR